MALNASKVLVGTADQATTGAILSGDLIGTSAVPTTFTAADALLSKLTGSGYVNDEGLTLSTDYSTNDVKEWNGATVRKLLESFDGTLSWTGIQLDYDGCCQAFGAENVTKVASSTTHGEQIHIAVGAHLPEPKTWAFAMKDGDARIIIVVPNGQVTALDEITFTATDPIGLPITLSAYDDGTGESIHIFVDDGEKSK